MKRFVLIFLILLVFLVSACSVGRDSIRIYEADFTKEYYEALNVMFDNNWAVVSIEDRFKENDGYICECGFDGRAQEFTEWTIEYTHENGDTRHFVLSNHSPFTEQVQAYLRNFIADYYKENFFNVYITDVPLAPSSYVSAFWLRNFGQSTGDDVDKIREMENMARNYLRNLGTSEGAVPLSQVTPANVFEMVPMYLVVRVSFSGDDSLGQEVEEQIMRDVEDMIESMNAFTNNSLNATFVIGYHQVIDLHTGNRHYRWYYIQGERVDVRTRMHMDRTVFESYRGVFW